MDATCVGVAGGLSVGVAAAAHRLAVAVLTTCTCGVHGSAVAITRCPGVERTCTVGARGALHKTRCTPGVGEKLWARGLTLLWVESRLGVQHVASATLRHTCPAWNMCVPRSGWPAEHATTRIMDGLGLLDGRIWIQCSPSGTPTVHNTPVHLVL